LDGLQDPEDFASAPRSLVILVT